MIMTKPSLVRGEDIYRIVEELISLDPNWAVESLSIFLSSDEKEESYVELHVFDVDYLDQEKGMYEKPSKRRFILSSNVTEEMYSKISQLVDLPRYMMELHISVKHNEVAFFNVKFIGERCS